MAHPEYILTEIDWAYMNILRMMRNKGERKDDRTGVGTISIDPIALQFDSDSFPLLGFKKTNWQAAFAEMICFLRGYTNIKDFHKLGCHVWDEFADKQTGELGPVYGAQWRNWSNMGIDQLANVLKTLKNNPTDRRMVVSGFNPEFHPDPTLRPFENPALGKMSLPPCHYAFNLSVRRGRLNLSVTIRSSDVGLGLPFNIAQYAMLRDLIAQCAGLTPGMLSVFLTGDVHVYNNHYDALMARFNEMMKTQQAINGPARVKLAINPRLYSLDQIINNGVELDDLVIENYDPLPYIRLPIAV